MKCKVFYHFGDNLSRKTKVKTGYLFISLDNNVYLADCNSNIIKIEDILNVDLIRSFGGGHCIKLNFDNSILFISAIRFCLFDSFTLINLRKTILICKRLKALCL